MGYSHLAKLAFAYNSTTHKSTGYSPFFLLMGREPVSPVDWVFGLDIENTKTGSKSYDRFVSDWKTSMQQALEIARRNSVKSGEYNKGHYDKKVRGMPLTVGDKVLCRNREKGGTKKLRSYWENNIYTIIQIDPDIPVLTIQDESGKEKRIHRNNVTGCNEFVLWEQEQQQKQSQSQSSHNSSHNHVNQKSRNHVNNKSKKSSRY